MFNAFIVHFEQILFGCWQLSLFYQKFLTIKTAPRIEFIPSSSLFLMGLTNEVTITSIFLNFCYFINW